MVLRSIFPQELPLLISAAGLELVSRFGDLSARAIRPWKPGTGMPVPSTGLSAFTSDFHHGLLAATGSFTTGSAILDSFPAPLTTVLRATATSLLV